MRARAAVPLAFLAFVAVACGASLVGPPSGGGTDRCGGHLDCGAAGCCVEAFPSSNDWLCTADPARPCYYAPPPPSPDLLRRRVRDGGMRDLYLELEDGDAAGADAMAGDGSGRSTDALAPLPANRAPQDAATAGRTRRAP